MPLIHQNGLIVHDGLTVAQKAAQEQMRRALEEDQYSLVGSIIDRHRHPTTTTSNHNNNDLDEYHLLNEDGDDSADEGDHPYTNYTYNYRGAPVRLDKAAMIQAVRKYALLEQKLQQQQQYSCNDITDPLSLKGVNEMEEYDDDGDDDTYMMDDEEIGDNNNPVDGTTTRRDTSTANHNNKAVNNKKKRKDESVQHPDDGKLQKQSSTVATKDQLSLDVEDDLDRDGGSIFGATTGQSNSTWVECDKCKKWRRLRGVVDEKKLPSKWYCSMNKNDPERARCSAPEEEYETSHTPESAADSRTRKHLRVWVRRLQCNEAYEARQPTLTRGKKRNAVSSSSTNPYEWVRCCNPSCGKWRSLLRIMDAKQNVVDRCTTDGEWYCVMNNWDEKMASCAAPQENLPAIGCPPWVMQDSYKSS
jgi:CW-type Zinc Finger